MKRKIFSIDVIKLAGIIKDAIRDETKVIKMQYADSSPFESNLDPKSLEIKFDTSELLITVDCVDFPEVDVPTKVPCIAKLLDTGGMVITDA